MQPIVTPLLWIHHYWSTCVSVATCCHLQQL